MTQPTKALARAAKPKAARPAKPAPSRAAASISNAAKTKPVAMVDSAPANTAASAQTPPLPNYVRPNGKLGILFDLLTRQGGVSVHDMAEATGWQLHSVRGAMAGGLKHKGFVISSEKTGDAVRLYRIVPPAKKSRGRPRT